MLFITFISSKIQNKKSFVKYFNRCIYNQLLFNILQVISQKYGRNL